MQSSVALCERLAVDIERLAARYRELQEELAGLVAQVGSSYPREELIRHALEGSIKLYDAIILAGLIETLRPARILEVGGFIGFSTRWLLEASRAENATLVSVDPNIRHRVFERPTDILRQFNSAFLNSRLVPKCGFFSQKISGDYAYDYEHYTPLVPRAEVDAILDSRPILHAGNLGEEPFDFVFIDGDHGEQAVLSNFAEALKLVRPGGCIAFHDAITWPDVGRALGRIATQHADIGEVEILGHDFLQHGPAGSCDGIGVFRLHGAL